MGFTHHPLVVRLFINRGTNGYSERIPILETEWEPALLVARKLAECTSRILAKEGVVEWATLAQATSPWYEQAVLTDPLPALPQWNFVGSDMTGLWWDFYSDQGQVQGRLFRTIEREQISNKKWGFASMELPPGIPALPADLTTATKRQLFENCFCTYRDLTAISRKVQPEVPESPEWRLYPCDGGRFFQVSSRRPGGIWHRQSWEAVPRRDAPPFSPCGMVTGVGRRAFLVQARFYEGALPSWIHYYRALPGALVYPHPHIFWGRFRDQDVYNSFGVGELTGNARRWWVNGEQYGTAAGDHFSGPIEGFQGRYVPGWSPIKPTPPALIPACDNIIGPGPEVTYGGSCIGGADVGWTKISGPGALILAMASFLANQEEEYFDVQSFIADQTEEYFHAESVIAEKETKLLSGRSVIANKRQNQFSTSSSIKKREIQQFAVNSSLKKKTTKTFGVDSYLGNPPIPAMRQFNTAAYTGTGFTYPSPTLAGTLLVIQAYVTSASGNVTLPTPSGWSLALTFNATYGKVYVFYRANNPGGITTVPCVPSGAIQTSKYSYYEFTNMSSLTPVDKTATAATSSSLTLNVGPTATLSQPIEVAVAGFYGSQFTSTWNSSTFLSPWNRSIGATAAWGYRILNATTGVSSTGVVDNPGFFNFLSGNIVTFKQ